MKKSWWTEGAVKFAVLAAIGVLKAASASCQSPQRQHPAWRIAARCKCSHSLWFTASVQCLRLSWAAYSLALTPCRQVCNTARVRAVEGGPLLSILARDTSCGMAAAAVTKTTPDYFLWPLSPSFSFSMPIQGALYCSVPDCFTQMERWFVFHMHREITSHSYTDNCVQSMKCHWFH